MKGKILLTGDKKMYVYFDMKQQSLITSDEH